ncbi:MAG: carboxypeptidase regulatory-like domain-containing protein [Acidobacteria bacterium]|nr:carboxypeptidase regulatory-like domain-containing protein [Acidobacteriota bacterium]
MQRFLLILAFSLTARSQTFGDITGEVKDSTGAVVPSARVTATNSATNTSRDTVTNEAGIYRFPSLVPGMYAVRVEASGFRAAVRNGIELQVQQTATIDFALTVGQVNETVEVSATASLLNTQDATVGTVIEQRRIVDLPLNGRNFLQLVSLSPNVTYGFSTPGQANGRQGGSRTQQNISVSGMRGTWNNYTLDGIANTDINFNLYIVLPSVDALQEFKVQSGIYPAEFGRSATQINVSTKPGTNELHGAVYWFLRNSAIDARAYDFDGRNPARIPFRWNQYGATVGGPVVKNRLFFLANFEGFKERRSNNAFYTVPTAAMRGGNFSAAAHVSVLNDPLTGQPFANKTIPASRLHPNARILFEFWPDPNIEKPTVDRNFQRVIRNLNDKDQITARGDFHESSNSQWFGRYSWMDESALNEGIKLNGDTLATRARQYMVSNTRVLSATKVNEFRFGYNTFYNEVGQELGGVRNVVKEMNLPLGTDPPSSWGVPAISVAVPYSGFGNGANGPFVVDNKIVQFVDNFSWVKGKHSIRFGGEYRYDFYNQIGNEFARGRFTFDGRYTRDSVGDMLLGDLARAEAAVALALSEFRASNFALYVDDIYRVNRKLTLNLGLRYEFFQPYLDKSGTSVNSVVPFLSSVVNDPNRAHHPVAVRAGSGDFYEGRNFRYTGITAVRDGRLGARLINNDWNNFAPRLGIAYSPSDKWVVRTGAGVFFSAESGNSRFDMNRGMAGRLDRVASSLGERPNTSWTNFLDPSQFPVRVPSAYLWGVHPHVATSYSMMYLLNVQRSLSPNTSFEIGYNGALHRKLQGLQNKNAPLPGTTNILLRRPYPDYGFQQIVTGEGFGNYNGLGMKFTTRTRNGLTAMLSYTWSAALDNTSAIRGTNADITPQDNRCLDCEYGHSAYNTPHRFVNSTIWDLPFGKGQRWADKGGILNQVLGGWQVGTIMTIQNGRPINSAAGYDAPGTGSFGDPRGNTNGRNPYLPGADRTSERWLDRSAFFYTAPGTFGNIARNRLLGPSQFIWDFSTLKNFPITENHRLQFRFEAFNFPNHPVLGNYGASWGTNPNNPVPDFGRIRGTATSMRQVQFGLKYLF